MHPISSYNFLKLDENLSKSFIRYHNRIYTDIEALKTISPNDDVESYLNNFLNLFEKIDQDNTSLLSKTIICSSKQKLNTLLNNSNNDVLKNTFDNKILLKENICVKVTNQAKNSDNDLSLKEVLLLIFNYEGRRKYLLSYFGSKNIGVCAYCQAQFTTIYKSRKRKGKRKIYLQGTLDHVKPKESNPYLSLSINNLVPVCAHCNQRKLNKVYEYDPFNQSHKHDFDFTNCIVLNSNTEVVFESLEKLSINTINKKVGKLSKNLDYHGLYQNFNPVAKVMVSRFNRYHSSGYKDSLNEIIGTSDQEKAIQYFISDVPLNEENILRYPLTKFKMDLYAEIKFKISQNKTKSNSL